MSEKPVLDQIDAVIKLGRYTFDEIADYELDESCDWVAALYEELEENTDREDADYQKGFIACDLTLKRKSGKPFGDHLLIKGNVRAKYASPCVRCLKITIQEVDADFQVCFVPQRLEKEPEFEELDDVFTENEEFALYFHDKGDADIAEMVHENLFMNIEHFPLHDENCLGLCPECGQDLNTGTCKHQDVQ